MACKLSSSLTATLSTTSSGSLAAACPPASSDAPTPRHVPADWGTDALLFGKAALNEPLSLRVLNESSSPLVEGTSSASSGSSGSSGSLSLSLELAPSSGLPPSLPSAAPTPLCPSAGLPLASPEILPEVVESSIDSFEL